MRSSSTAAFTVLSTMCCRDVAIDSAIAAGDRCGWYESITQAELANACTCDRLLSVGLKAQPESTVETLDSHSSHECHRSATARQTSTFCERRAVARAHRSGEGRASGAQQPSLWPVCGAEAPRAVGGTDARAICDTPRGGGERGEHYTSSSSDAPSMPSSFVNVAEQRTMARPMAPIQSSFSFSVSAHIK